MAYYRGVFVSFDLYDTYYVSCGLVQGGELDVASGKIDGASTIIWRHGRLVFVTTPERTVDFPVDQLKQLINGQDSREIEV